MPPRPDEPSPATPAGFSELQKPLEKFRAKTIRIKIHPLEVVCLWLVCAHLVFLPWALGGMRPWAHFISLTLAILGFGCALLPRNYSADYTGSAPFRLLTWPKLVKFPIFWIGLLFLAYVTIQALNPAWTYETDGKGWWMRQIEHKTWLPTGVDAPFERWNPWRMLLIYSAAWLTVCTIWVGFTRRRTVQMFLMALAFNGLLLATFGIAQRLLGNGKIFWFVESPNASFFSTFIYKNHGAIYLNIMLGVTCSFGGWYYWRGLRRLEKSNPSGIFAFSATAIATAVLTSYARGATLVMLCFLAICITVFLVKQVVARRDSRSPTVAVVLVLLFAFFLKTGFEALRAGEAWSRLRTGLTRQDSSLEARELATTAASEMLHDSWPNGVGAGAFRYIFPVYQHRHAALISNTNQRFFWEHAHNDILQFPIEVGIIGTMLITLGFLYFARLLMLHYFWTSPMSACVSLSLISVLIYAWWDFPFQCPAILISWCSLWPAITMWIRFEEAGTKA